MTALIQRDYESLDDRTLAALVAARDAHAVRTGRSRRRP
jgi:hypothetical protein